jgi:hypothetical protein
MFPSTSLLSTREEWRECGNFLADMGFRCILVDWPGWHQRNTPLNWAMEEDVTDHTLISAYTHFVYTALRHFDATFTDGSLHIATAGGNASIHVRRALTESNMDSPTRYKSLSCFSPTWRFYLSRFVPEGYPRKFARRQWLAETLLDGCFVRSKNMYRIYKSRVGLSKLTKRMYEEPIKTHAVRFESKKEVITRDRPLTIDAAMIAGRFDPVNSTQQFLSELFAVNPDTTKRDGNVSDDDEDDDTLLSIKVPQWAKDQGDDNQESLPNQSDENQDRITVHMILPEDAIKSDQSDLRVVKEWAIHHGASVSSIPGRLFCHEESPALSASILSEFVSQLDDSTVKERKQMHG